MTMQLQEGSTIMIPCAKCGQESYPVVLISGSYRIQCSNYSNWKTEINITKDGNGNLNIQTRAV